MKYGKSAMMMEYIQPLRHPRKYATKWHQHPTGQIYWVTRGMVMVETELMQWALTPGAVGWFPPALPHRAWMPVDTLGASLHLEARDCGSLPSLPCIRAANPFLMLLLENIRKKNTIGQPPERQSHLLQVMIDEIQYADVLPAQLVLPHDRRARQIAQKLLTAPECGLTRSNLAEQAGLSVRTLSRLFVQQTGLTFSRWRQKAKVIMALEYLLRGESVSQVAELCGYENVSSFIAVFSRFLGTTPGRFQSVNQSVHQ